MTMDATILCYSGFNSSIIFFNRYYSFIFFPPAKKRMFPSLTLVVSAPRTRLGASKVEKILFLSLTSSTKFLGYGRLSES